MTIAQLTRHVAQVATPIFLIEAKREHGLSAAGWRLGGHGLEREPISHHVLSYHPHSGATMTRTVDGVHLRKALRPGAVTLARATDRVQFSWDSPLDVVHIYIHPESVQRFADEHLLCGTPVRLDDFFCIDEPWLAGYFQMLASERESIDSRVSPAMAQFLDASEPLLLDRLIRCHSNLKDATPPRPDHTARPNPLRPTVMRRIEEHVCAHLPEVIHLTALAEIANMSVDHFLRSFRAAAGTTPHRYILGLRLAKASSMLRETVAPIAVIAAQCGFQSASHFSVAFSDRFGMRPSHYRRSV
ncbi:MAG TPA: helix-turn-helix transcriptional regulator [Burkholderiaceae bacterium]